MREKPYRFFSLGDITKNDSQLGYLKSMLLESRFYFQNPKEFNDPFDCKPNYYLNLKIKKAYDSFYNEFRKEYPEIDHVEATKKIEAFINNPSLLRNGQEELNRQLSHNLESCGIMCLSASLYNILLWAHYANGHQEYCIAFYKDKLLSFAETVGLIDIIKYQKTYPFVHYYGGDVLKKILKIIYTKSDHWEYEQEWRFFIPSIAERLLFIPHECIYAIYMGQRISENNEKKIIEFAKSRKHKISVFKMRLSNYKYAAWREKLY